MVSSHPSRRHPHVDERERDWRCAAIAATTWSSARGTRDLEARARQATRVHRPPFECSAFQGARRSTTSSPRSRRSASSPLAFVDMRMPPAGMGRAIERSAGRPRSQIVLLGVLRPLVEDCAPARRARVMLILKKPFDTLEVVQCARAHTKWTLAAGARARRRARSTVASRTSSCSSQRRARRHIRVRERMETELRLSQKLEAVGQLAAGVATRSTRDPVRRR